MYDQEKYAFKDDFIMETEDHGQIINKIGINVRRHKELIHHL
jgi:hypothetical protein